MTEVSDLPYTVQTVVEKKIWVPGKLFSIKTTRSPEFSFKPGQYARLGLALGLDEDEETPAAADMTWRAFSMVNQPDDEHLEFFATLVPEGLFSPSLYELEAGDTIYIDKSVFGFLTIDQFPQGGDLWLLSTGTGLSAFLPMLSDAKTWQTFDRVILCHGTRFVDEFAYTDLIQRIKDRYGDRFVYLAISTREAHQDYPQKRLTDLIVSGELADLAGHPLDPEVARLMLCGNPGMTTEARKLLGELGFKSGRRGNLGNLAVEKYW
ncbi:Flavodoxin/ferredoxin--NADP reductase [Oligella sp. MSHR50489EDL]|uniref:ferredoxin--NADP reductase n=1 Tax=Oligella sp. MSHR50489EDL TaxID=3139409 RepID=UPI003D8181DF